MLSAFRPKGVPLSSWKFLLVLDHKFSCLVFMDVLSLSTTERFYPAISIGHCFSHPAGFVSNALCLERVTKFVSSAPPCVCRKWGCALAFEEVFFLVLTSQYGDCCIQQLYFLREREKSVCVHVCAPCYSLTVIHRCESPHVGAGYQTQVLWKSSKCF